MLKNISIKVKLAIISAISLLGLAMTISYVAIQKNTKSIIDYEMQKLSTVEATKHMEINKYLKSVKNLLTSLAQNKSTQDASIVFDSAFKNLNKEAKLNLDDLKDALKTDFNSNYISEVNYNVPKSKNKRLISEYIPKNKNAIVAQYIFITDNPASLNKKNSLTYNSKYDNSYMRAHKKYHNSFNSFLTSFNLYDVFLINLDGDVIYTGFKEKDFATNLKHGIYSNTGLARVYKKALNLKTNEVAFEDFEPYEPSYNSYASFIATPIYVDGKISGVLAFQMPVDHITKIMQFDGFYEVAGLGKTGECYLVGQDYMMRSNSRFQKNIKDKIVQDLQSTIGVFKVKTKSTINAFSLNTKVGNDVGSGIIKDYRGKKVLSVYHSVNVYNQAKWAIIAEIDEDEALIPVMKLSKSLWIVSIALLFVFVAILIFITRKIIVNPLDKFQNELLHFFEFLKGKTLDVHMLKISSNDEIGRMASSINDGILIMKDDFEHKKDEAWIKDGINKLNNKLAQSSDLKDVTYNAIHFMCTHLNAGLGVMFVVDSDKKILQEYASFAHVHRDSLANKYEFGEGIVGQVALQKSPILLTQNNEEKIIIKDALQSKDALNTYTYPLLYQNNLFGVMEVASVNIFSKIQIEFLNASSKVIATAISTSMQNTQVKKLLKDTELANIELQENQAKLEEANTNMEEQQQKLEIINANMEEQQQQLEEANANMEEQQQQLQISEQNLKIQNESLQIAQKETEEKANELEMSNKYKSEFLANMSHELRTPLNAIILLSQLLSKNKKENLNKDDVKKAQTIFTSGNELLRLINDILDLSKVESGKMEVIVDHFHSSDFLKNIENLFESSASEKNIEFKVIDNYQDIIHSDSNKISQIIRNLISNSLKFTKDGSITLEISKGENDSVVISVSDTGIGIPLKKQEQIFQAFTQADGSTSRKYGGTGLGLSISKELSHLLGGQITLQSEENKGSKFEIVLPSLDENTKENTQRVEKIIPKEFVIDKKVITNSTLIPHDDRNVITDKPMMLIIDDDVIFADIVYENIKKHKHLGVIAHNAQDGLNLIAKHNISAIMLDLTLPDIDGIEVLKELKANDKTKNIPIYIISSKDRDDTLLKMGAIGYGQKPLVENDIENVLSELESFIQNHKTINNTENDTITANDLDLSDLTVMVVDDDIKNIFVLDSALSEYDINVKTAYNGKEAIDKLKNDDSVDLILMDIMMPVMNGYEAIEAIRADEKLSHIPIIAVTAKAMKEDKDKCMNLGADDFVSKPINMDALIKLIDVWSKKKHK